MFGIAIHFESQWRRCLVITLLLICPTFLSPLHAAILHPDDSDPGGPDSAVVNWVDPAGGFFDVGSNWSTGFPPGTNDSASFAIAGIYTVRWDSITGNVTTDDLFVLNGSVTMLSAGSGSGGTIYEYNLNDDVVIGAGADLILGSSTDPHHMAVGGVTLVDDGYFKVSRNSTLELFGPTRIGASDTASGYLNAQGSSIFSTQPIFIGDGDGAHGRYVVAGDSLATASDVKVANAAGSTGRLEIAGTATVFDVAQTFDVGVTGTGSMEIRSGAQAHSIWSAIGYLSGGRGTVTVREPGTRWEVEQRLDLGFSVDTIGTLIVQEGAEVETINNDITIGVYTGTSGCDLLLTDSGSQITVGTHLYVGGASSGTMTVMDDASLNVSGTTFIRPLGYMEFAGSGFPEIYSTSIENDGQLTLSAATPDLHGDIVNNGNISIAGTSNAWVYDRLENAAVIDVASGGNLRVLGVLSGTGIFTGPGNVELVDDIEPGAANGIGAIGALAFNGNLVIESTATTAVELAGPNSVDYDRLIVGGDLTVGGTLDLYTLSGFVPSASDQFMIAEIGGNLTGQFIGLNEGDLVASPGGVNLYISYQGGDGNDIVLTPGGIENVHPDSFTITRGDYISGSLIDLNSSDNQDLVVARRPADIQSVTQIQLSGTSPTLAPTSLEITLECSVFARSTVTQTLALYNFDSSSWETVDSRAAQRFADNRIDITATGDLARFVSPSFEVLARVHFQSTNQRQQFTSSIDELLWKVGN